jgi:hypothetical protein
MNATRPLALAAWVLVAGLGASAPASALEVSAVCRGNIRVDNDPVGTGNLSEHYGPGIAVCLSSAAATQSTSTAASGSTHTQGHAGPGRQQAYASALAEVSLLNRPETFAAANVLADSEIRVVDRFRLTSGQVAPGALLSVTLGFHAQGSVSVGGLGHGQGSSTSNFYSVTLVKNGAVLGTANGQQQMRFGDAFVTETVSDGHPFDGLHAMSFNVTAGSNIDLYISLRALSSALTQAGVPESYGGSTLATSDMGHSITWAGISAVRDAQGNLLTEYSALSADSGFDYAAPYVSSVPEPGAPALLLAGLAALGFAGRRRSGGARRA